MKPKINTSGLELKVRCTKKENIIGIARDIASTFQEYIGAINIEEFNARLEKIRNAKRIPVNDCWMSNLLPYSKNSLGAIINFLPNQYRLRKVCFVFTPGKGPEKFPKPWVWERVRDHIWPPVYKKRTCTHKLRGLEKIFYEIILGEKRTLNKMEDPRYLRLEVRAVLEDIKSVNLGKIYREIVGR